MTEKLRAIPGYNYYVISESGVVYRTHTRTGRPLREPRKLKAWIDKDGYWRVLLCENAVKRFWLVHRLVCLAWYDEPPFDAQVCHADGVRTNNHYSNLRWGTAADNAADRSAHGSQLGEKHGRALLTEKDVIFIRSARVGRSGIRIAELAKMYGVSRATIDAVRCGRNWRGLAAS